MILSLILSIAVASYNVVPLPQSIDEGQGKGYVISSVTGIKADKSLARETSFLQEYILESSGLQCSKKGSGISLEIDSNLPTEGYCLEVTENGVKISGGSAAGVFYGVQTLRKSLPKGKFSEVELPAVKIEDSPLYEWRGLMLDCARHFFTVDFVKEYIDLMALHNMNRFHWHLTDDQGWRIPIKGLPELVKKGSQRSGTVVGNNSDVDDETPYGGYYTRAQIKEIIKYAAERHIEVIPEIDVPGHASAILACYPELGCTGGPYKVGHKWGVYNDVLCIGNPKTTEVVKKILSEVMDIFLSQYIHIGGDETPTVRWEACSKCEAVSLGEGESLQGHFTREIAAFVESKGKRIIGWDEMLGSGIDKSAVIMSWRGTTPGEKAAQMGHDVIMTPLTHCYFDYYQCENTNYEPSITGMWPISVDKVYSLQFDPSLKIMGVQANLWTEHIASEEVAEYMVLPRMAALCEVQWTASRDADSFRDRLTELAKLYDIYGYKYAVHFWPERVTSDRWHIDQ